MTFQRNLKANTKRGIISKLKQFYSEAVKQDWILASPYVGIKLPKEEKNPIKTLSVEEMKRYLETIKVDTVKGIRDRALLELMYSCALRASDVENITKASFGDDYRTLRVIGKGDKESVLPVTKVAAYFIKFYLENIHAGINVQNSDHVFISTRSGKPFNKSTLYQLVRNYGDLAFENKFVGTHVFRYSCISHLAQNGVEIRVLQEFCRHEKPSTTMRYINENFKEIESVFQNTHPRSH